MSMAAVPATGRPGRKPKNPWKARLIQLGALVLAVWLGAMAVKAILKGGKPKKPVPEVVQLKLLAPPPPPPPPPPPKVEPPKQDTPKVETPAPTPTPQAPTPKVESPPALAADSSGPGDLSGKAGGTPYTGDSSAIGTGGGGGGGGNYTGVIVSDFRRALLADDRLRTLMKRKVRISVSVTAEGRIEKVTVLDGDKPEVDRLLERRLAGVGRISSPPPEGKSGVYELDISPVRY